MESSYHTLAQDMLDEIMLHAIEIDQTIGCVLACTCKTESNRYTRLVSKWDRLTYHKVLLEMYNDEIAMYDKHNQPVLPGEKGYDYLKEKYQKGLTKISRAEKKFRNKKRSKRGKKNDRDGGD